MLLHRKNDSRDASVKSLKPVRGAGSGACRILLDAEQELRRDEKRLERPT